MSQTLPMLPAPRLDLTAPDVTDAAATAAILADPIRAGILRILADGPHCVCEMAAAFGARDNNVSNHLARLREAGLVRASRHDANGALPLLRARRGCRRQGPCRPRRRPPMTTATLRRTHPPIGLAVAAGTVLWIVAWFLALPASEWASYGALGLERGSQAGDSIAFFLYDVPKVLLLLTGIVTAGLLPSLVRVS